MPLENSAALEKGAGGAICRSLAHNGNLTTLLLCCCALRAECVCGG